MVQKTYNIFSWALVSISVLLPTIAWGSNVNWQIDSLTAYQWFPLLGLLAWMIMATHYFTSALRVVYPYLQKPRYYSKSTSYVVLACILLHPGLLAYSEWRNTNVLPPESFVNYVGESLVLASMFGSIALTLFLLYEVVDRLKHKKALQKNWWLVSISQTLAMVLIFIHALRLGGEMQGWFLIVWVVYGVALLPCFYIIHSYDLKKKNEKVPTV